MVRDKPKYELQFHTSGRGGGIREDETVAPVFRECSTQPASPHPLPPEANHFTGRQQELAQIRHWLQGSPDKQDNIPVVVAGAAGVGKSALIVRAAHQLRADFPDAQLYVNLRGTESQPLEPSAVLAGFLRALGVEPKSIPTDLSQRVTLYRSLLSNQRVAILLDDARDGAQVRPLLPPHPGCAVLITSRRRLAFLDEAAVLNLSGLNPPEALALLQVPIGAERTEAELEAARTITDLCRRLPLALQMVGGTLKAQPHWRLSDYVDKLTHQRQQLAQLRLGHLDVRASFSLSEGELDAGSARLFRFLGLLSGASFTTAIAARLVESTPEVARAALQRLVDLGLLESVSTERYRFHDLIRLFAKERLAQAETTETRQAARLRVVRWYEETAGIMDLALNPQTRPQLARTFIKDNSPATTEQDLVLAASNWFEQERTHLIGAVEWAHQAQARDVVVSLTGNLVNFLNSHGYWSDWERTHRLALEAIRTQSEPSPALRQQETQTWSSLGNAYSQQRHWEKARECYEQSLTISRELGNRSDLAKALGNLGNVYAQQQEWEQAKECYDQSLETFRELDDPYSEGQTLANMGILYLQQGDEEKAIALWQNALTKLPPDFEKSQQVKMWLQSLQVSNPELARKLNPQPPHRTLVLVGGAILVGAIAIFLIFSR